MKIKNLGIVFLGLFFMQNVSPMMPPKKVINLSVADGKVLAGKIAESIKTVCRYTASEAENGELIDIEIKFIEDFAKKTDDPAAIKNFIDYFKTRCLSVFVKEKSYGIKPKDKKIYENDSSLLEINIS